MKTFEQNVETLKELEGIEMEVLTNYTLADAIREGAKASGQAYGWIDAEGNMCALSAAQAAAKARGYM